MGLVLGRGRQDWSAHFMAVVYFIFGDSAFLVGPKFADRAGGIVLPRYCNLPVLCNLSMLTSGSQCSVALWRELVAAPLI